MTVFFVKLLLISIIVFIASAVASLVVYDGGDEPPTSLLNVMKGGAIGIVASLVLIVLTW